MKKYLLITVGCICFLILLILINSGNNQNNAADVPNKNLSPESVVKLYIDSAVNGDEKTVSALVTKVPDSYSTVCIKSEDADSNSSLKGEKFISDITPQDNLPKNVNNQSNDKFLDLSNADSENSLGFLEARYVYATNSMIKAISVSGAEIYEDEAIVEVEYTISETSKNRNRFLLKKSASWKVFTTESLDISSSVLNSNYAKPRPYCD